MTADNIPPVVITHAGKFHADDVFSSALLKMLRPDVEIRRLFEVPEGFDGIVYDIGGGRYDHHQKDAEVRENGTPYAAFGLLWRTFGQELLARDGDPEQAKEEAVRFDEKFVQPLDEDDNTGSGNAVAGLIGMFNPSWDDHSPSQSPDACFAKAVEFAMIILQNKLKSIFSIQRAKKLVETALTESKGHIVVLPCYAPWKNVLAGSGTDFVIYPSQRGGYCAQTVPEDAESGDSKYHFPEAWAGKSEEELRRISGVDTLTFCHNGRFLISTATVEDAVKACAATRKGV